MSYIKGPKISLNQDKRDETSIQKIINYLDDICWFGEESPLHVMKEADILGK